MRDEEVCVVREPRVAPERRRARASRPADTLHLPRQVARGLHFQGVKAALQRAFHTVHVISLKRRGEIIVELDPAPGG